jgi:hypothetical protein
MHQWRRNAKIVLHRWEAQRTPLMHLSQPCNEIGAMSSILSRLLHDLNPELPFIVEETTLDINKNRIVKLESAFPWPTNIGTRTQKFVVLENIDADMRPEMRVLARWNGEQSTRADLTPRPRSRANMLRKCTVEDWNESYDFWYSSKNLLENANEETAPLVDAFVRQMAENPNIRSRLSPAFLSALATIGLVTKEPKEFTEIKSDASDSPPETEITTNDLLRSLVERLQSDVLVRSAGLYDSYERAYTEATRALELMRSDVSALDKQTAVMRKKIEASEINALKLSEAIKQRSDLALELGLLAHDEIQSLTGRVTEINAACPIISPKDVWENMSRFGDVDPFLAIQLLAALDTHLLIVLTGPPGQGKSSLVRSLRTKAVEVHEIPVRPNWHSPVDILGYENPFLKEGAAPYIPPLVRALLKATATPETLHVILLDEMNLAPVEHYFSDFLSALEFRDRGFTPRIPLGYRLPAWNRQQVVAELLRGTLRREDKANEDHREDVITRIVEIVSRIGTDFVEVPSNVRFVGTVNIDETTRNFSPRVIDRSAVIRVDSSVRQQQEDAKLVEMIADRPRFDLRPRDALPTQGQMMSVQGTVLADLMMSLDRWSGPLKDLGRTLAPSNRRVGQARLLGDAVQRLVPNHSNLTADVVASCLVLPVLNSVRIGRKGPKDTPKRDAMQRLVDFLRADGAMRSAALVESLVKADDDFVSFWSYS